MFRSHPFDAVGLWSSIALSHLIPDPIALVQRLGAPEDRHVHEQVRASRVRGDEAEPALRVVTLDHSLAAAHRDV